jgi:Flp pilus assembly protein TadG
MKQVMTMRRFFGFSRYGNASPGIAPPRRRRPPGRGWISRVSHLLSRLDDSGATAVEFMIVAPMLFLLLVTIIDLGLMLTTQSLLDGAARNAARLILTGQVQDSGSPLTTFQNTLCAGLTPVMSTATCQTNVIFEVQNFGSFGAVGFTPCTQNSNPNGTGYCTFDAGTASEIVGVQVIYNRPFIVPWVGGCLTGGSCWFGAGTATGSNPGTNTVPLTSTVVFMNEPFPS